jgi:pimeloyl-ACP methyl ester carboxylesterase
MVDIGTHSLHIYCIGEGSPTVVIDVGVGESYTTWQSVQEQISHETRVCAYDRAGYGQSEPGPLPRDAGREADELRLLLQKAGVKGPYVLVGHSLGAINAQVFASRYPSLVAGAVLLDPTPLGWLMGDAFAELRPMFIQQADGFKSQAEAMRSSSDPKERATADFYAMVASEMTEALEATAQQLAAIKSFGDMPLTVVAATKPEPRFGDSAQAFQQFWIEQSEQLAKKSTQGVFIRAEGSSHHIHLDAPQLVIDAIAKMVRRASR